MLRARHEEETPTMMRILRSRLSYGNVTATVALFIALGGTGYAAIALPRNSVGSKQIRGDAVGASEVRRGAVTSEAIRNRTVKLRDIGASARNALRGAQGPQGPAGPPGITFRAAVPRGGTVARGNALGAAHQGGTNEYRVSFDRDVSACVATATLATVAAGGSPDEPTPGRITLRHEGAQVVVRTFDAGGAAAEQPFNLVVAC
jgi:hypothetical protein